MTDTDKSSVRKLPQTMMDDPISVLLNDSDVLSGCMEGSAEFVDVVQMILSQADNSSWISGLLPNKVTKLILGQHLHSFIKVGL